MKEKKKSPWSKNFTLLLQGNAISDFGDILYSVAIGFWVFETTHSTTLMGLMSSISMIIQMCFAPFSGTLIDRINRKKVMVYTDIFRGIIMLFIGYLCIQNHLNVSIVLVASVLASFCSLFFNPAIETILIDMLDKDTMVKGQSIFNGVNSFVTLASKAISGAMIAFFGVGIIIIINGISYLLSALSECFIDVKSNVQTNENITFKGYLKDLKCGFMNIIDNPFLRFFIPMSLLINFLGSGSGGLLLAWFAHWGYSVDIYGYVTSMETAAYLFGTLLLSMIDLKEMQRYQLFKYGFIISGLASLFAYLNSNLWIIGSLLVLAALGSVLGNALFNSSLFLKLPENNKGSIIGFLQAGSIGGMALSNLMYGILSDIFPITYIFIFFGIISLIPLYILVKHPLSKAFICNLAIGE